MGLDALKLLFGLMATLINWPSSKGYTEIGLLPHRSLRL